MLQEVDGHPGWRRARRLPRRLFAALGELRDLHVRQDWIVRLTPEADPLRVRLLAHLGQLEAAAHAGIRRAADDFDTKAWGRLAEALPKRARLVTANGLALNAEAGRQLGFLPGSLGDKMAPWAKPILDNLDYIMRRLAGPSRFTNQLSEHHPDRRDGNGSHGLTAADLLERNVLEIAPINYLRGRSIHDAVVIVDDGQNLTQEDMKLVLTRAGEGTRVILTGDPDQIDRSEIDALSNGLVQVVERFKGEPTFAHLTMNEVVRSRLAELAAKLL